jgi:hypothetical protein
LYANLRATVNANAPTIVRYQDIVDDINLTDSASRLTPSLTKNDFLSSFTHEQSLQIAETLRNRTVDTLSNLPTDYNPIVLANKAKVNVGGKTYKLTINGYAMTERIYTTHIAEDKIGTESKLIFYNALKVEKGDKLSYEKNTSLTDVKNIRKAFDIIIHDSTGYSKADELKSYLKIKGSVDLSGTPTVIDNGITLRLKRLYSNTKITLGELTVDGDPSIKLLTVELKKGTKEQSQSNCNPQNKDATCFRIYNGDYKFELNTIEETSQPQHRYKSLRLTTNGTESGGNRAGILIHTGWNYGFTEGCILTMNYTDVQNVIANPHKHINYVSGEIKNVSMHGFRFEKKTQITFKNSYKDIYNNSKITFSGFDYDGYNTTFTVTKIDDRNIIIDHAFHKAEIKNAKFVAEIGTSVTGINWNNSAPTTMSLYEYVEKHVPNGTIKGKIIITEDNEKIDVPVDTKSQIIMNIFSDWADLIHFFGNR